MKTYDKPKLFTFSRAHAAVPAVVASFPVVSSVAQAVSAAAVPIAVSAIAAKKLVGDDRVSRAIDSLLPVETV